ncbi:MAG: MAPEG family protein [Rhizobiaceae bacterium]|jgi:hypothetical protein|nr:MAPEG family protein [Rhizobiaceae bacterium]
MMIAEFLWTGAVDWKIRLLVLALAGQMILTIWLYGKMSKARMSAGREGKITAETYRVVGAEPPELAIYTRAVANQFELPVMFYAVVIAGLAIGTSSWITVVLAFAFVALRFVHAQEMVSENKVMTRRKKFLYSVRVFIVLLVEFVFSAMVFI